MAITKIKAIRSTVGKAIGYIMNPRKTDGKLLVSGYRCAPETAAIEFGITADAAADRAHGDYTRTGGANVLAYHLIQSFSPHDPITPEQAHEVGEKLAAELLHGRYEYVIATHIDRGHIHNHLVFNAFSVDDGRKFRCQPYKTARKIRAISDRLCEGYGLSVLCQPAERKGMEYKEWDAHRKGQSWKDRLQKVLDDLIAASCSYEELMALLRKRGIEIKEGKHLAFRLVGQECFIRGRTLGDRYSRDGLALMFLQKEPGAWNHTALFEPELRRRMYYAEERKKLRDLKVMASLLNFVLDEKIATDEQFKERLKALTDERDGLRERRKVVNERLIQKKKAAHYLAAYRKYLPVQWQLEHQPHLFQHRFERTHAEELEILRFAEGQLKKRSMLVDTDPQELAAEIVGLEEEVGKVSAKTKQLEKQVWNYMHARAKLLSMLHMPVERTERERRIREKER